MWNCGAASVYSTLRLCIVPMRHVTYTVVCCSHNHMGYSTMYLAKATTCSISSAVTTAPAASYVRTSADDNRANRWVTRSGTHYFVKTVGARHNQNPVEIWEHKHLLISFRICSTYSEAAVWVYVPQTLWLESQQAKAKWKYLVSACWCALRWNRWKRQQDLNKVVSEKYG